MNKMIISELEGTTQDNPERTNMIAPRFGHREEQVRIQVARIETEFVSTFIGWVASNSIRGYC